mgnify:FL=1
MRSGRERGAGESSTEARELAIQEYVTYAGWEDVEEDYFYGSAYGAVSPNMNMSTGVIIPGSGSTPYNHRRSSRSSTVCQGNSCSLDDCSYVNTPPPRPALVGPNGEPIPGVWTCGGKFDNQCERGSNALGRGTTWHQGEWTGDHILSTESPWTPLKRLNLSRKHDECLGDGWSGDRCTEEYCCEDEP